MLALLPAAHAEGVVNVFNWEDYIDPEALTLFETETGINSVDTDGKIVKLVNYYDLDGREVPVPGKGVFIKKTTYTDGTKKSVKFVNR